MTENSPPLVLKKGGLSIWLKILDPRSTKGVDTPNLAKITYRTLEADFLGHASISIILGSCFIFNSSSISFTRVKSLSEK